MLAPYHVLETRPVVPQIGLAGQQPAFFVLTILADAGEPVTYSVRVTVAMATNHPDRGTGCRNL